MALEGKASDNLSFLFTNLFNGARSSKTERKEELIAISIYITGEVSSAEKYGGHKNKNVPSEPTPISHHSEQATGLGFDSRQGQRYSLVHRFQPGFGAHPASSQKRTEK
jgi:hypothetical protein